MWNFLYGFSMEKNLESCSLDELNIKLKELDLDKHLDTLEKAFEVQKFIIQRLKEENSLLKKEIKELKDKFCSNTDPATKVPYPDLVTKRCNIYWSNLENNAVESRIVDAVRKQLVKLQIELEVQPWLGESSCIHPLILFCPMSSSYVEDIQNLVELIRSKTFSCVSLVVIHETSDRTAIDMTTASIKALVKMTNVKQVLNAIQFDSMEQCLSLNRDIIDSLAILISECKD